MEEGRITKDLVALRAPPKREHDLIGYAIYYYTYSTKEGRTLMIEDLLVRDEFRGMKLIGVHMGIPAARCV